MEPQLALNDAALGRAQKQAASSPLCAHVDGLERHWQDANGESIGDAASVHRAL